MPGPELACEPRASPAWPRPAAPVQGSRHRLAQAGTGCNHQGGWAYEEAGCFGVQRLQGELAGLLAPGTKGLGDNGGRGKRLRAGLEHTAASAGLRALHRTARKMKDTRLLNATTGDTQLLALNPPPRHPRGEVSTKGCFPMGGDRQRGSLDSSGGQRRSDLF